MGLGRYAHAPEYLRGVLGGAGFELRPLQAQTLRMEGGEPVPGWLVSARRPAAEGPAA